MSILTRYPHKMFEETFEVDTVSRYFVRRSSRAIVWKPDGLYLTEAVNGQAGQIWLTRVYPSYVAIFEFRCGGGTGADGMTFVLDADKDNVPFSSGGNLGLGMTGAGKRFWAVEFDNFRNSNFEPTANHIALIKDGVDNHIVRYDTSVTEDNVWHECMVRAMSDKVYVYVDNKLVLESSWQPYRYGWIGFTAGTGGLNNEHVVRNIMVYKLGE